jgi:4-diphosphocytidyl-2-C-methyl-D-erythritol kinase
LICVQSNSKPRCNFTTYPLKSKMIVFPIAKINLGLSITGKRTDGYHNIETIFYPVGLCDALEFMISPERERKDIFAITGYDTGGRPQENLVLKTVRKLREYYSLPYLKIHLHKGIPAGAGLGGGSSDAAFILKALNRYFKLAIDIAGMKSLALEMGSDCPFFIEPEPALARGRGEILEPLRPLLKGYHLILVNPGINVSTKDAYMNCKPTTHFNDLADLFNKPVDQWKDFINNDFEEYVFRIHPQIGMIKKEFYKSGAIFSSMTGSGSSVYGIYNTSKKVPQKMKDLVIYEGEL